MRQTLALAVCTLLLAASVEAAPRKVKPAPVPSAPLQEQWCAYFGRITGAIVVDRDRLVPLTTTLGRLRVIMADVFRQVPYAKAPQMTEMILTMASDLYATPGISPALARHTFEVGCLRAGKEADPTQTLWR